MPNSLVPSPEIRPTVRWYWRSGDVVYRIYQAEVGGAETCIGEVTPDETTQIQEWTLTGDLDGVDGVWHKFRVEVLDSNNMESTRLSWVSLIRDQPDGPSNIAIAKELAGTFKVTLTA